MLLHELKRRVVLAPDDAAARAALGAGLLGEGDAEAAVKELEKAALIAPDRADFKRILARAYRLATRKALAFRVLQEAVRIAPDDVLVRDELAALLVEERRIDDALVHLEEALRAKPDDVKRRLLAADLAVTRRLYPRALGHLAKARASGASGNEVERLETILAIELGAAVVERKDEPPPLRGRDFLLGRARATAGDPSLRPLLRREALGRVVELIHLGEVAMAKRALVLASAEDDAGFHWLRGELLLVEGDASRAKEAFERAAVRAPKFATVRARLAEIALFEGDFVTAEASLAAWRELAPNDADALELSGDVAHRRGDASAASQHYAAARAIRPTPALAMKLAASRPKAKEDDDGAVILALGFHAYGGITSRVEALAVPGQGELVFTGNVGKTGREAASIAHACLKARGAALGIEERTTKFDLHLHFVDTELEKDGPSAGIALALVAFAAYSGRALRPNLAATGEITLQGAVRSIGGLHEKLVAAYLAGVTRVVLPEKNLLDVRDLPEEVVGRLELLYVRTLGEALDAALKNGS